MSNFTVEVSDAEKYILDISTSTADQFSKRSEQDKFFLEIEQGTDGSSSSVKNIVEITTVLNSEPDNSSYSLEITKLNDIYIDISTDYPTTHPTISAASSVDNSGNYFIQDLLFDSYGHVTGVVSVAVTGSLAASETDPIFTGSVAYNISASDTGNWTDAYTWITNNSGSIIYSGNNISSLINDVGYLTGHPSVNAATSSDNNGQVFIQDLLLDEYGHITGISTATASGGGSDTYITGVIFNTGDKSLVLIRDGGSATGDLSSVLISGDGVSNLNNDAGYLSVETDPIFTGSVAYNISSSDTGNWNTAYGWGNHATGGYLISGDNISLLNNNVPYAISGSHISINAASSVNNTGNIFVQDILLDEYGHITGITTAPASGAGLDNNYYVTGITFNSGNNHLILFRTDGGTVTGILSGVLVSGSSYHIPVNGTGVNQSGRTYVQDILVDAYGHITGVVTATETVVDTNTEYTDGVGISLSGTVFSIDDTVIQSGDNISLLNNDAGYISGYTEIDPIFTGHITYNISSGDISNWNASYGWGDHSTSGYATTGYVNSVSGYLQDQIDSLPSDTNTFVTGVSYSSSTHELVLIRNSGSVTGILNDIVHSGDNISLLVNDSGYINSETDPVFTGSAAYNITIGNISNWNEAYSWGDHSLSGYITGYTETGLNTFVTGLSFDSGNNNLVLQRNDGISITGQLDGVLVSGTSYHISVNGTGVDGSGRTYVQDILVDSYGHITGINTATETVVDTNTFVTGISYNSISHELVLTRNGGSVTGTLDDVVHSGDNISILFNDKGYITGYVETGLNTFVTGIEYDSINNNLVLSRNDSQSITGVLQGVVNTGNAYANPSWITSINVNILSGIINSSNLPSYVDDVLEYTTTGSFPATGESGKIYLETTNNRSYRWGGSTYIQIVDGKATWGGIDGSLSNQTDLWNYLQTGHISTNATGSVNNIGRTYIQDIFIDSYGHVTGLSSSTETVTDTFVTGVSFNPLDKSLILTTQNNSATGDLTDIIISGDNISLLVNNVGYITSGQLTGLNNIVEDLTPQLGGFLDLNGQNITGTGNIAISGNITTYTGNFDVISFDVNNESILTKGQISWNDTEGTMDIGLTDNTTIHIGEHRYFRIRNETGGILYKGQVVYATGVHSNGLITPAKYVADGTVREVRFMGLVLENVNHNNNGYVVDFGHLENMDLDGSATNYAVGDETWSAGDILYVHPTGAGKLTKNEPKHSISVAIVLDPGNGNGNGRMFVRPISYGHLDDNHDVAISGATNGQFLQYNSVTDYWVPSSSGNFTTLQVNGTPVPTGVGTTNYVTKWTGTNSLDNGSIYDSNGNVSIGVAGTSYKFHVVGSTYLNGLVYAPAIGAGTDNSVVVLDTNNNLRTDEIDSRVWGSTLLGASTVGTANRIPYFNSSNNLASSNLTYLTNKLGIVQSSPVCELDINGDVNITDKLFVDTAYSAGSSYTINASSQCLFGEVVVGNIIGSTYHGLKHKDQASNDFLLTHFETNGSTYVSCDDGSTTYIGGGNKSSSPGNYTSDTRIVLADNTLYIECDNNNTLSTIKVNNERANTDFIVYGNVTSTPIFFTDANVERVGIGTSSPSYVLDVNGTVRFSSTIDAANIGTGEDNSVVILDSDGKLRTDEIDARVWGSSLVDGSGTTNYIAKWSDGDTLTNSVIYDDGGNEVLITGILNFELDAQTIYIGQGAISVDISATSIDTSGAFTHNGSLTQHSGNIVFNNSYGNYDFKIRGLTEDYLFFTNADANAVQIGTSSPAGKLAIANSSTNTSYSYALHSTSTYFSTSSSTYYDFGLYNILYKYVNAGVSDTGFGMAGDLVATLNGNGTLAGTYGLRTYAGIGTSCSSGTNTTAYGLASRVINNGTVTSLIGEARGVDIYINGDLANNKTNVGITTAKGLNIQAILDATNKWAIYQEGANDKNYFNGDVGIGTSTPSAKLNVENGNVIFNDLGGNYDFRVEGDTLDYLLHTDASKDEVVIHNAIGYGLNYATSEGWVQATGTPTLSQVGYYGGNFASNGAAENYVDYSDLPNGLRGLVWQSRDNGTDYSADGGWGKEISGLDPNKTYISIVYFRRVGSSTTGTFYHGCKGNNTLNLSGTTNSNPYFHAWGMTNFPQDVWCVSIGIIHANNDTISANSGFGGIYRLDTGEKIYNLSTDYKMAASATIQTHRTYLYYDTVGDTDADWCWPGFYEVTADSIVNLLNTILYDHFSGRNITINEGGGDYDFRVEGDTDANLLSVDASLDRVGIGILVPQAKLDIRGSLYANDVVTLGSGSIPLPRKSIELLNPTNIAELTINESYTFPTTDGSADQILVTDGSGNITWQDQSGGSTSLASIVVTSGQSVFNMVDTYASGSLAVFLNGIKLVAGDDFTETSSTSFTLASPAASGDIVDYVAYGATIASTNLQKTGDTMTGNLTVNADLIVKGYKETHLDNGNTGTSQTISITSATLQTYTLTGNCTFTMPTADAGRSFTMFLKTGAGSYTASFTNVKWPQNSAPTITSSATRMDILTFYSDGTNWYGNVAQDYYL